MKHNLFIKKADDDEHKVFGWASVAVDDNGEPVEDLQGDVIDGVALENAVYDFVVESRMGGDMHETYNVAVLCESVVFTPEKISAMGISGVKPYSWWVGFLVTDPRVWENIRSGERGMFSIGGYGERGEYA